MRLADPLAFEDRSHPGREPGAEPVATPVAWPPVQPDHGAEGEVKAGRNSPQSVLLYIDAVWAKHAPPDPLELSRELGHDPKRYRRLKEKHGDGLLAHLQKEQRHRTEQTLFMAKQNGLLHPPQYVSSASGAIDDAEAPPPSEIEGYRASREARDRHQAAQMDEVGVLMVAMREVRASLDALPAEKKRSMSRVIWTFKGRMDALEREIRRRAAA